MIYIYMLIGEGPRKLQCVLDSCSLNRTDPSLVLRWIPDFLSPKKLNLQRSNPKTGGESPAPKNGGRFLWLAFGFLKVPMVKKRKKAGTIFDGARESTPSDVATVCSSEDKIWDGNRCKCSKTCYKWFGFECMVNIFTGFTCGCQNTIKFRERERENTSFCDATPLFEQQEKASQEDQEVTRSLPFQKDPHVNREVERCKRTPVSWANLRESSKYFQVGFGLFLAEDAGGSGKSAPFWWTRVFARDDRWVFPKIGVPPKWMVYFMENPIKMDDLGVPLFLETPIYIASNSAVDFRLFPHLGSGVQRDRRRDR